MSRNDDSATGNVLDFSYYQNNDKLTATDLSRHANTSTFQQIKEVMVK